MYAKHFLLEITSLPSAVFAFRLMDGYVPSPVLIFLLFVPARRTISLATNGHDQWRSDDATCNLLRSSIISGTGRRGFCRRTRPTAGRSLIQPNHPPVLSSSAASCTAGPVSDPACS
jgi:hypothetical protein